MRCLAGRCVIGYMGVLTCSHGKGLYIHCVCMCVHLFLSLVEDVFYDEWLRMSRGMHVVSGVINH